MLKRAKPVTDPKAMQRAIAETNYASILAPVDWRRGPVPNVSKTPIVAGQWERAAPGEPLQMVIKANAGWSSIPKSGTLKLLS